jgi:hypothetical protein
MRADDLVSWVRAHERTPAKLGSGFIGWKIENAAVTI